MREDPPALTPDGRPLVGRTVRLDRTVFPDAPGLFAARDDARVYEGFYAGGPLGRPAGVGDVVAEIAGALAPPARVMYTVRLRSDTGLGADGAVVGTTSLHETVLHDRQTHIGWTAYAPSVWGTRVNPECKLLLLTHAFEDCGMERVKIQTDLANPRSQAAIAKLGAVREGVLRHHRLRADGTWRDTVVFSILREEWPAVREGLAHRIG